MTSSDPRRFRSGTRPRPGCRSMSPPCTRTKSNSSGAPTSAATPASSRSRPASVLVFGIQIQPPQAVLLRKLLVPDTDSGFVVDAVHTEADYTVVLTSTNNLYRYASAPLLSTDNPDTVLRLSNYVTLTPPPVPAWAPNTSYTLGDEVLDSNGNIEIAIRDGISSVLEPNPTPPGPTGSPPVGAWNTVRGGVTNDGPFLLWKNIGPPLVFNSIFGTNTFADVRVLALSGPNGCFLIQLDSALFTVQGFFEISVESGLVYGANNVQWLREASVESLHTGKVLLGTLDETGHTYETLIDLPRRVVIGTWDASKLKNQFVTTGEILFEAESTYVGLPLAPVMGPVLANSDGTATLSWVTERPDLATSYQVQMSTDGSVYNLLASVGSGTVQTLTTRPLATGHTYSFEVRSGSPDGFSPYSAPVVVFLGTPLPPLPGQIVVVTGPVTGPFVATVPWSQSSPGSPPVQWLCPAREHGRRHLLAPGHNLRGHRPLL